jgi:hypothetical protein
MLSKYEIREIAKELAKFLTAKQEKTTDEFLTTKEAAAFLKVSVHTLHKTKDAYPHRKVGKRLMFSRNALNRMITGTATASL